MSRLALFLTVLLMAIVAAPANASAHSGVQSYLYLSLFDDGIEGRIEIPVADLERALGVDLPPAATPLAEALDEQRDAMAQYVDTHTSLGDGSSRWAIDYGDTSLLETENGPYALLDFVVVESFTAPPRSFVAEFAVIIELDPQRDALLIIENDWRSGTFNNEAEHLLGFSDGMTRQQVDVDDVSTVSSLAEIRGLGSDAVRNGIDLMLIAAAFVASWFAIARGHRFTSHRLLAFSLAAAITYVFAGLGGVLPSTRVVGSLVAAALALLSIHTIVAAVGRSSHGVDTWITGLAGVGFGLGLGAYFVDSGLDRTRPVISLVAFGIGALIAAVLVGVFVAAPLSLLRRTRFAVPAVVALGVVFFGYAAVWFLERLGDSDWPIEKIANPLRVWPRNLVFVVITIGLAALVRWYEQRSGRLIADPVDPRSSHRNADAPMENIR